MIRKESAFEVNFCKLARLTRKIDLQEWCRPLRLRNSTCVFSLWHLDAISMPICGNFSLAWLWSSQKFEIVPIPYLYLFLYLLALQLNLIVHRKYASTSLLVRSRHACYRSERPPAEPSLSFSHALYVSWVQPSSRCIGLLT